MRVYAARQAILNRRKQSVAYELFFRDGVSNSFPNIDSTAATSKLMLNHHFNVGFKTITRGKRALINFSEQAILARLPTLLPANDIVVEILEDVPPSEEVFQACREMFHQGYRLALDDFQYHHGWEKFMNFTRLIKFDIQHTPLNKLGGILPELKKKYKQIKFLAEKIETYEEYEQAREMGFDFFQGYFFCRPEMMSHNDIDVSYQIVMAIYAEVLKPNFSYDRLARLFEKDVSLTYKLLKFINSGLFVLVEPIGSIKQGLVYLGEERARKFISLIATAHLGIVKPMELIRMSVIRARFCEFIAEKSHPAMKDQAFLLGLFSLIDAILDKSMEDIVQALPLVEEIREALIGYKNVLFHNLELVKAYESGSWYNTQKKARVLRLQQDSLAEMYNKAVAWSESFEEGTEQIAALTDDI
ncbi:HDOD domain-containing protein [Paraneptunicella aestuarii]|uniref:EAL and HDOD domain-containing protein n=1 Tax=Paraneptunicella aestuarii TaxID=2831148 RepID=UPI001E2D2196|nr:HDOD domain-containing protein [Paraneptunicella aestuarii]UAA37251.1 HDOD domain-containing protein [Paraneptunicella aestuarii]